MGEGLLVPCATEIKLEWVIRTRIVGRCHRWWFPLSDFVRRGGTVKMGVGLAESRDAWDCG